MGIGEWTEILQTGWSSIDSNNKQFLDLMKAEYERNVSACDTSSNMLIQDLFGIFVYEHFVSEEMLLYKLNTNKIQEHTIAHTVLIDTTFQLITQQRRGVVTNLEILEIITNNFITHVIQYDKNCYSKWGSLLSDVAIPCILSNKGRFQR